MVVSVIDYFEFETRPSSQRNSEIGNTCTIFKIMNKKQNQSIFLDFSQE